MNASSLHKKVLSNINMSSNIEFAWSKNSGVCRHTAIVLKFDEIPLLTIDYGQEGGYLNFSGFSVSTFDRRAGSSNQVLGASSQSSAVIGALLLPGSNLRVNGYDISTVHAIRSIGEFAINSPEKKKFIKKLMVEIAMIKMDDYAVLSNNCRDFVDKAIDIIEAALERFQRRFIPERFHRGLTPNDNRFTLEGVRRQDNILIGAGIAAAAAAVGMGILVSLGSRSSNSDEDD